jgi:hypothetical protein
MQGYTDIPLLTSMFCDPEWTGQERFSFGQYDVYQIRHDVFSFLIRPNHLTSRSFLAIILTRLMRG